MPDLLGATLGPYRITREIGRGGMAIVYEAYQASLNRTVAIKVLPQQFTFDREFVARFLQEARSAAQLSHPNIVPIYDVGQQNGWHYIVMQHLTGEPLSALLARDGRLAPARALHIVSQVASALDYAHARGIIHRDVKSSNIIIGPGDATVLTDFGIAKAMEGTNLTRSGAVMGTPEYMSPEQANGMPVGPASDLYSLGIVLYEMLGGRPPFQAATTPALLHKQVYEAPPPLRSLAPELPPAVDAVLARALAKDPAGRYGACGEMAHALRAALAAGSPLPGAASWEPATRSQFFTQRLSPGGRLGPPLAVVGLVMLIVALIGGLVWLLQPFEPTIASIPPQTATATEAAPRPTAITVTIIASATSTREATPTTSPSPTPMATSTATASPSATMTVPVPTKPPTQAPSRTPTPAPRYLPWSLAGIANNSLQEGYANPPVGRVTLGGVLFDLGQGRTVTTQASSLPGNPLRVRIDARSNQPQTVYLLLTGGNLYDRYAGQRIGRVQLIFSDGRVHSTELVAGANLREWRQGDGVVKNLSSSETQEVWASHDWHDGTRAVIDMLRITVPDDLRRAQLAAVEVVDTSQDQGGDLDPAINWLGLTVLALN